MVETTTTGESGFAARYASALYELAFEQGMLDRVIDEMTGLGRLLAEPDGLGRLVQDRLANGAAVAPVVQAALAAEGFSAIVQNFVNVAIANRRLRDLPAMVAGFAAYVANKRGEIVGYVTSAHKLSDLQRAQLHARLTQAGYGNVRLMEKIDPALLGGMTLKIGPKLYDTSLKSRLERLTSALKGAA